MTIEQENNLEEKPDPTLSLADRLVHCDYQSKKKELAKEILFLRQYGQFRVREADIEQEERSC